MISNKKTASAAVYFDRNTPVVFPSGTRALFLHWKARRVEPGNPLSPMERVAIVQIYGDTNTTIYSERFMSLAKVG